MTAKEMMAVAAEVSKTMGKYSDKQVSDSLLDLAHVIIESTPMILAANAVDLSSMEEDSPMRDRLLLTEERIRGIASDMCKVAGLPSPLGKVREEKVLSNGMSLTKVSVPLGVVGVIYEARPNVTFDVVSLCLKSGNVVLLKGGSDARHTNEQIVELIKLVLIKHQIDGNVVNLLPSDREAAELLLKANGYVDVIIPRGGRNLIDYVRQTSTVPVIETGAGICHTYFDEFGDAIIGAEILFNAKTRRVSVCNALDCLIVHRSRLSDLPALCAPLAGKNVLIYGDEAAFFSLSGDYPGHLLEKAAAEHFGMEFLDYKMAVFTVDGIDEAVSHINKFGSKHSEAIISQDAQCITYFFTYVDAAAVYSNASTAFTDGAQFGMGAEIGISTQKLHARGPMGLDELTSYKWLVSGNGQVRQ